MTDTPSIQARDLAVKPAGYSSWDDFIANAPEPYAIPYEIALAYAADLDKADKVGRMVQAVGMIYTPQELFELQAAARGLRLPEPQPTLLEEFKAQCPLPPNVDGFWHGAELALNWIANRELAKEQDRG